MEGAGCSLHQIALFWLFLARTLPGVLQPMSHGGARDCAALQLTGIFKAYMKCICCKVGCPNVEKGKFFFGMFFPRANVR